MTSNKEIQELKNKLKELEKQQHECKHQWGEVENHTEYYIVEERDWGASYGLSDDIWKYKEVTKSKEGWKRECNKCGYIEYSYSLKPVVVEERPFV